MLNAVKHLFGDKNLYYSSFSCPGRGQDDNDERNFFP